MTRGHRVAPVRGAEGAGGGSWRGCLRVWPFTFRLRCVWCLRKPCVQLRVYFLKGMSEGCGWVMQSREKPLFPFKHCRVKKHELTEAAGAVSAL